MTKKTTTVVYLVQFKSGDDVKKWCGKAFFGSARQPFVIDMDERSLTRPASPAAWRSAHCDAPDGEVIVDRR